MKTQQGVGLDFATVVFRPNAPDRTYHNVRIDVDEVLKFFRFRYAVHHWCVSLRIGKPVIEKRESNRKDI